MKYKIVRVYHPSANRPSRVIKSGLTLKEAQEHCRNPKTHNKSGPMTKWYFDGYDQS